MKTFIFAAICATSAAVGYCQDRHATRSPVAAPKLSGAITNPPETWFYGQDLRRDNPREAVRRKAELRAAHRQQRLESMKWYGMSNSRPSVSPTPWFGSYSPAWTSSNADPYRWSQGSAPLVIVRPSTSAER